MTDRPNLHHHAEALAEALPPLLVASERVASIVAQGVHGRRRVGQGESFWQFRRYQPGDSSSLIDWRQSAKSQPVYVRETEWEAAQSVWLWRDTSTSMTYNSRRALPTKSERADLLLLALASLLVRGGEHVTHLGSGIAPGSGRGALYRLAATMENGADINKDRSAGESLPAFELLPRYAHTVWIGDFLSPLEDIKAAVDIFATQGLKGHILQVLDPAEETLPFEGRIRFEGLEHDDGDVLIGRVEVVRDEYRDIMDRHQKGLADIARSASWTYATHHTDRPPESALMALFVALSETIGS